MLTCKKKNLLLVTSNSSLWKRKKFRQDSAAKLKKHRKKGWRLLKKTQVTQNSLIDTRIFHKYTLSKKIEKF